MAASAYDKHHPVVYKLQLHRRGHPGPSVKFGCSTRWEERLQEYEAEVRSGALVDAKVDGFLFRSSS